MEGMNLAENCTHIEADAFTCKGREKLDCDVYVLEDAVCLEVEIVKPKCIEFKCKEYKCLVPNSEDPSKCRSMECTQFVCNKYSRGNMITEHGKGKCKRLETKDLECIDNGIANMKDCKTFKIGKGFDCFVDHGDTEMNPNCAKVEAANVKCKDTDAECIPVEKVCDSNLDCKDGSDEEPAMCGEPPCPHPRQRSVRLPQRLLQQPRPRQRHVSVLRALCT